MRSRADDKIAHVVHVSTNISTGCEWCHFSIGGSDNFPESVNHYIQKHGYKLLHVGSENDEDNNGRLWSHTVAVLASDRIPPPRPVPTFRVRIEEAKDD